MENSLLLGKCDAKLQHYISLLKKLVDLVKQIYYQYQTYATFLGKQNDHPLPTSPYETKKYLHLNITQILIVY